MTAALRLVQAPQLPKINGRRPACDLGAEADVVGELLMHPELTPIARGIAEPEDFFDDALRIIARAVYACHDLVTGAGRDPELVTPKLVLSWLKDRELVQRVAACAPGGNNDPAKLEIFLQSLRLRPSCLVDFAARVERVKAKSRVREASTELWRLLGESYGDYGDDAQEWLDGAVLALRKVAGRANPAELVHFGQRVTEFKIGTAEYAGLSTGLPELNMMTGGFQNGDMWTITAPPGGGKTAYVLDRCIDIAQTPDEDGELRNGALLFSHEMTADQIVLRGACREAMVDGGKVKNRPGLLTVEEHNALNAARVALSQVPFYIDPRTELSIETIRGTCHRARTKLEAEGKRLAIVAIDYFQLLGAPDDMTHGRTRAEQLDVTGKRAVDMAKELAVPVLLLAQLTKDGKHIADCSSLRKHTQNWLNIRTKTPPPPVDERDPAPPAEATFQVRKQRGDKAGNSVACWFHGAYQRYSMKEWIG